MTPDVELLERALASFECFYRLDADEAGEPAFSATYLEAEAVTAACSVRRGDATYRVTAWPAGHIPLEHFRLQATRPVTVYIDGVFVTESAWRLTNDGWNALIAIDGGSRLELTIEGRCDVPPSEISLARDRPDFI